MSADSIEESFLVDQWKYLLVLHRCCEEMIQERFLIESAIEEQKDHTYVKGLKNHLITYQ